MSSKPSYKQEPVYEAINQAPQGPPGEDSRPEAERLYRRVLDIKEKVLGADHPEVAMTLNNLAVLYKGQGRYTEAESLYRRALSIFERVLGPEHPKVVTCRENYAKLIAASKSDLHI